MIKELCAIVCFGILLAGCASKTHYYQSQADSELEDLKTLALNLNLDKNRIYLVDTHPDPTERLASAEAASAAVGSSLLSTPLPAGTSPGEAVAGVAIGMVLGMQILKSFEDSSAETKANKKAAPIEQIFPRPDIVDMMSSFITDAANRQEKIRFIQSPPKEPLNQSVCLLFAEPELHFNEDLSRLKIKVNARIKDGTSKKLIYQNSFEYWSQPVGLTNQCEENCKLWIENGGKTLRSQLKEGCEEVVSMLLYDLKKTESPAHGPPLPQKTHRIVSKRGSVFLRSSLVREEEDRVWLKDLRGNLRSIYGKLEQARIQLEASEENLPATLSFPADAQLNSKTN